jgi:hypothetical protein
MTFVIVKATLVQAGLVMRGQVDLLIMVLADPLMTGREGPVILGLVVANTLARVVRLMMGQVGQDTLARVALLTMDPVALRMTVQEVPVMRVRVVLVIQALAGQEVDVLKFAGRNYL